MSDNVALIFLGCLPFFIQRFCWGAAWRSNTGYHTFGEGCALHTLTTRRDNLRVGGAEMADHIDLAQLLIEWIDGKTVTINSQKYILEVVDGANGAMEVIATPVICRQAD